MEIPWCATATTDLLGVSVLAFTRLAIPRETSFPATLPILVCSYDGNSLMPGTKQSCPASTDLCLTLISAILPVITGAVLVIVANASVGCPSRKASIRAARLNYDPVVSMSSPLARGRRSMKGRYRSFFPRKRHSVFARRSSLATMLLSAYGVGTATVNTTEHARRST